MARHFVNVSWNNAATQYDGYQQMNKHLNPNGTAAIHNYSDEALHASANPPKKLKKKRSAFEQATLADTRYTRLQALSEALNDDLEKGSISMEDFLYAQKCLRPRIDRAWKQISKVRGWDENNSSTQPPIENLNEEFDIDEKEQSIKSLHHPKNEASIFYSLNENNTFRKMYEKAVKLILIWKELKKC